MSNEPTKHDNLREAVCHAMLEMTFVGKGEVNRQEGYSFRSVDDAMAGVRGPLLRHGVIPHITFGRVEAVNDLDPYFWRLPITLTLLHAHSDEMLVSQIDGLGRQAGKGNVTNPDPRAVGQAASYGIKTLLINSFMLAGGDDSADHAPHQQEPARSLRSEPPKVEADPQTERARVSLLDVIAAASPQHKEELAAWCKAEGISVLRGDMDALRAVNDRLLAIQQDLTHEGAIEAAFEAIPTPQDGEPVQDEWVPESEYAEQPVAERVLTEQLSVAPGTPLGRVLDELAEEGPIVPTGADVVIVNEPEPERHLAPVPEPTPEPPKRTRRKAEPVATTPVASTPPPSRDVRIVPEGDAHEFGLSDQQFAYLLATNGAGTSPSDCAGDRDVLREGLRLFTGLRTGRMIRQGTKLVDTNGQEIVDGTEALARHQAS